MTMLIFLWREGENKLVSLSIISGLVNYLRFKARSLPIQAVSALLQNSD